MIISDSLIDYLPNDKKIAEDSSHLQMFVAKFCEKEKEITLDFIEEIIKHQFLVKYVLFKIILE